MSPQQVVVVVRYFSFTTDLLNSPKKATKRVVVVVSRPDTPSSMLRLALSALAAVVAASTASIVPLAERIVGMYLLLADDSTPYHSTAEWTPKLHEYQQVGANALFLSFINP